MENESGRATAYPAKKMDLNAFGTEDIERTYNVN